MALCLDDSGATLIMTPGLSLVAAGVVLSEGLRERLSARDWLEQALIKRWA